MKLTIRRTVGTELTFLLSIITLIIAVLIGIIYYLYASHVVTARLLAEAEQTADEFAQLLVLPLYNYDETSVKRIAEVYLASGRIGEVLIETPELGVLFHNPEHIVSSLPNIEKEIFKDDLYLGSVILIFDDHPLIIAQKQAVLTTLVSVLIILFIYVLSLRIILNRILIQPLSDLGSRLKEISQGSYDGHLDPVPQHDLNKIVTAANSMSGEIARRTKILLENERTHRTIYNSSNDAFFIYDAADDTIVDVNQTTLDMFGYTREEIIALHVGELSVNEPPYGPEETAAYVKKALTTGPQIFTWRARRKNGSLFWVEVALKRFRISDLEVLLVTIRDISQRIAMEKQLRQVQKLESLGTLAGGIAHDFNNILTSIMGYTELSLMHKHLDAKIRSNLQHIASASKRARTLIQQILTFSRKQKQEKTVVQLKKIVIETLELLRPTIPTTIQMQTELNSTAKIIADPSQLHQLIMNLCTNGYQAMPDATGTLIISLKDYIVKEEDNVDPATLSPGNYVLLEVSDNGAGMNAETQLKIFEPYFTTKKPGKGTGLGMSTVYGIIQSHNGQITVHSKPGAGTTFKIFFPVTHEKIEVPAPVLAQSSPAATNKKVMVVDDDEDVRILTRQVLVHGGYQVDCFNNGSIAWQAIKEAPLSWDLLVTDQTMPEMTGVDLIRKVLRLRPDMPVILCTGFNTTINSDKAQSLGVRVYLQKPISVQEMLSAAYEAIHGSTD